MEFTGAFGPLVIDCQATNLYTYILHFIFNLAFSDDRSSIGASIVSLSDKYRQQEEVEIFHEHYQKPPPEPVRPKKASISSQSTQSSKT
jgi:hypothetical protein